MAPTAAVARPRPRDKSVCAGASERDRCVVCCRESVAVERIGSVSLVRPTGARVRERGTVKTTEHAGVSVRQAARRYIGRLSKSFSRVVSLSSIPHPAQAQPRQEHGSC
jgi:hypothetical protein